MRDVTIPEISENVESGTVLSVLVSTGDTIKKDDPILELETDKAAVDLPSPASGTVAEILVSEGDEVSVGDIVARLEEPDASAEESGDGSGDDDKPRGQKSNDEEAREQQTRDQETDGDDAREDEDRDDAGDAEESLRESGGEHPDRSAEESKQDEQKRKHSQKAGGESAEVAASPSTRRFARELGVDLASVEGSGPGGRISKDDVKTAVRETRGAGSGQSRAGGDRREEMTRVRRLTAENTTRSWQVPHVTHFDEADITRVNDFIENNSARVNEAGGKLTVTAVLIVLCSRALRHFPRFNASVDMEDSRIIYHSDVNIGVAVDTDRGLLVPVVRQADQKGLTDIAAEIVELAEEARSGKIDVEKLQGGTFSISNLGGIGGTGFTPVIQTPQVAILGVSRASAKPVYDGERFQARQVLPFGLSYDHRANDGADAARFVRWLRLSLEDPFRAMMEGGADG